jgi:hypothetical protein
MEPIRELIGQGQATHANALGRRIGLNRQDTKSAKREQRKISLTELIPLFSLGALGVLAV